MIRRIIRFLLRPRVEKILRIDPDSKPAVYLQVFDGADIQNVNYWLELFLSAGIATLGLVLSSPAVVIGAMLVSPLMGPIIASGLALAAADLYLGIKSALQLALSIVGSILFAGMLVWIIPLDTATPEILARTNPNLLDLGVALFSGLAGSLLVCRSQSSQGGGSAALPGVAIAVALMPPLCTVGFGLGSGFDLQIMGGASLLFLTNLAAIVASAFFVFFLLRMDEPEVSLGIAQPLLERASHDGIYHWLEKRTAISRSFANLGKLRWRVAMLLIVLSAVLVPLSRALSQLTQELVARGAVEDAVKTVSGNDPDAIISRQSYLQGDTIRVTLVLATPVDPETVSEAERGILRRTGREARMIVRRVAGEEELQMLREGLSVAQPQAPEDVESIRVELMARIRRPLEQLWPEESACLRITASASPTKRSS
ncbi:MAG: DUF389 domain-containing protein [Bryobacterales bacterium]